MRPRISETRYPRNSNDPTEGCSTICWIEAVPRTPNAAVAMGSWWMKGEARGAGRGLRRYCAVAVRKTPATPPRAGLLVHARGRFREHRLEVVLLDLGSLELVDVLGIDVLSASIRRIGTERS